MAITRQGSIPYQESGAIRVCHRGPAHLATKKLELLGPRHLFRRLEPLRFFWRILDRTIRYDQRDGIVIATEQCKEASPRPRPPEVRGEFTIDFRRALLSLDLRQVWLPIDNSPGGERRHHLLALLERHLEPRAVAPCMDADISAAIDLQQVLAADMPQERPVHLELARTGPHCLQHRRQIQVSHSASSSNRAATKRPIHRAGRSCSSHRRGDLCREGWTVSRQADPGA